MRAVAGTGGCRRSGRLVARAPGAVAALLLGALLGCSSAGPTAYVAAADVGPITVDGDGRPEDYARDPLTIDSAAVADGILHVFVKHGGGCREHRYAAVALGGWLESQPVQVGVLLAHDARGDACKALLSAQLRFDLAPLKEAYARSYGAGPGELVLRLGPGAGPGSSTPVHYRF